MNKYAKVVGKDNMGRKEDDGIEGPHNVHAEGSGLCDMETLCGHVWSGNTWKETKKPVTCPGCLDVIALVHREHPKKSKARAALQRAEGEGHG
jgi:hypothetical protein